MMLKFPKRHCLFGNNKEISGNTAYNQAYVNE